MESEKDLETFFEFILAPFKTNPQEKAMKKFGKVSKNLKVELRRNVNQKLTKFVYVPEQHNPFYLRAQKMMFVFLFRKNYLALKNMNPFHIDIFFKVYREEILNRDICRTDMCHVMYMIQYFLTADPVATLRNIVKHHVLYEFLANIEINICKETLISLLSPGDGLFKISDKDRKCLNDYLEVVNFGEFFATAIAGFSIVKVNAERKRVMEDERVKEFTDGFKDKNSCKPDSKVKNMFQVFFHTFLNLTSKGWKSLKQPEEIYSTILDIDRIGNYNPPSSLDKRKGFLKKDSNVGRQSFVFDNFEFEDSLEIRKKNFLANAYHNQKMDEFNYDPASPSSSDVDYSYSRTRC